MIEHSAEVHGMAWAKPAREKSGDLGPEYRAVSSSGIPECRLLVFLRFQLNRNSGYLFLPLKTEVLKFHTVLFSVYFVSVRSL